MSGFLRRFFAVLLVVAACFAGARVYATDSGGSSSFTYTLYDDGAKIAAVPHSWAIGSVAQLSTLPYKPGYGFAGYYTGSNCSGTQIISYTGAVLMSLNRSATLYACWLPFYPPSIVFDDAGGSGGHVSNIGCYNILRQIPVVGNHGVYSNGDTADVEVGDRGGEWLTNVMLLTKSTPYYWGHVCGNSSVTTMVPPERSGYTFKGYYTGQNGTGTQVVYQNGTLVDAETVRSALSTTGPTTVHAYWESDNSGNYHITLNDAGGSGGTVGSSMSHRLYEVYGECYAIADGITTTGALVGGQCVTSIHATPTKTGYNFGGYYTGQNGSGVLIINSSGTIVGSNTQFTAPATIYAKWTPKVLTVRLNHNSPSNSPTPSAVYLKYATGWYRTSDATSSITHMDTVPTKTNYTFAGYWTTNASSGGTRIIDADGHFETTTAALQAFSENGMAYARWVANSSNPTPIWVTVNIHDELDNVSGATNSSPTVLYRNTNTSVSNCSGYKASRSCSAATVTSITPPTKPGYAYGGHSDRTGTSRTPWTNTNGTILYDVTADTDVYAQWTANDSGTVYKIALKPGTNGSGSGIIYEKYNVGWFSDSNGSYQITSSIFNSTSSGGAGLTRPTHSSNYTFNGYWTSGGTQVIDGDGNIRGAPEYNANQTLTAQWLEPSTSTIKLASNGGAPCAAEVVTATFGQPMPTVSCPPTRTNYVFTGYFDDPSGGNQYYTDELQSARNWDKTGEAEELYAHWMAVPTYNILYYCDEEDVESGTPSYTDTGIYTGQDYMFKTRAAVGCSALSGKKFMGWADDNNETRTPVVYQPGQIAQYPYQHDARLVGYNLDIKTVTLNHGSPDNTPSPSTVYLVPGDAWYSDSDATVEISEMTTVPVKYGYDFVGYYDAASGGTRIINANGEFNVPNSSLTTLYARYAAEKYEITLQDAGATTASAPNPVTYKVEVGWLDGSTVITSITRPNKDGNSFAGFWTGPNGTGTKVVNADGTFVPMTSEILRQFDSGVGTLYAKWNPKYTVTFSCQNQAGDGSGTPSPATVQVADGETLTFPAMTNCSWGNAGYSPHKWGVVSGNTFTDTHEAGDTITYDSSWGDRTYNMWYAPRYFNYEYSCDTGTGTPPANGNTYYHNGGWKTAVNTCTPPANKHFVGWLEPVSGVTYAENTTPTGGGWIWPYDVTAAAGGAFVAQYADDTYSALFNCSSAQASGTDKPAFINPSTGLENITGIAAGSTVVLPSTSLCEFNSSEFDSCAQLSCFIPTPGSKWTYNTGGAYANVSGEFTWPSNNDIRFFLRGFSSSAPTIRYRCGQAGFADGVTPTGNYVSRSINFANCGNVVISNNICNTPAHAAFAGWTVGATGGIGAFSVGQTVQPGALSNPQWTCDTDVNTYLDAKWECESGYAWNQTTGACDEVYTAHFTCENNVYSPYVYSGTAPADMTGIAYQQTITLPSPNVCTNNYPDAGWIDSPATQWSYSCTDANGGALGGGTAGAGSWTWPKQGNCTFRAVGGYSKYHISYYCDDTTTAVSLDETVDYTNRDTVRPATVAAAGCTAPTGHHFAGWKVGGTDTILQPGQYGGSNALWPYAQTVNLRAQWEPDTYNLTWSCGEGSGTPSGAAFPTSITYGGALEFPANTACTAPTGYEFAGWTVDYLAHTYSVGEQLLWNLTSGSPVIASFTPVKVNITYSCGAGATGAPSKATDDNINYGGQVTLATLGTCAKTGHTADKWVVSNTSPAASYNFGATVNPWNYAENKTLTPNWSAQSYNIEYELFGGTQASSGVPSSYTYGTTTTINGVPTLVGAEFAGWCDTESLTNCAMTKTISATTTGNKKFWAKWTCKTGYESNDIWLTTPVTVSDYSASGHTVYPAGAACIPGRYHINCNGNGGVACLEQVTSGNASNPQLHLGQFYGVRTAYGTGYDIVPGLATVFSTTQSNIESIINNNGGFYAFTRNPAYKTQVGADVAYAASTYQGFIEAYANAYNSSAVFGRDHYTFNGLWNAAEGGTQYLAPNTNFGNLINTEAFSKSLLSDTTVYAQWIPDVYTITLNDTQNGGSGGDGVVYEKYETGFSKTNFGTTIQSVTKPTKTGYTFTGYWTSANGGTRKILANGTLPEANIFGESTTLYAQFSANKYDVNYDCDADGTSDYSNEATYDSLYTVLRLSEAGCGIKIGHTFQGWSVSGTSLIKNGGDTFTWAYTTDKTLTAIWTPDIYHIEFNFNNGVSGNVAQVGTPSAYEKYSVGWGFDINGGNGSTAQVEPWTQETITLPRKEGYTFVGYYANQEGSGTRYIGPDAHLPAYTSFAMDKTLYAKWEKANYTVTYKNGGGTGDDVVQDVTYDTQFTTKPGSIFTKTNYVVTKWNTTSGGNYPNLRSGYTYSTAGNTVLTANWGACTCTKGSHVASCNVTGVANNTCQYSYSCEAGYNNAGATSGTFNGIENTAANTSPNCGGANSYTITVTAGNGISKVAASGWTNSGTTTMTKTFDFGDPIDLSDVVTATRKVGYTGVKYENTSGAGSISGNVYTVGAGNGTITVSAVGITEPVIDLDDDTTKVYNYQATTLTASNRTQYDTGITLQYTFGYSNSADGAYDWDTESDSNTLSIAKNEFLGTRYYKVMVSATDGVITSGPGVSNVVAVTLDQKRITFDATTNGGTLSGTSPLYVRYDSANVYTGATSNTTGTVPTATKTGYTFNGWYTAGGSQIYNASRTLTSATVSGWTGASKWRATEDKTLYAQFSANTYSIAYTLNGGAYGASHPASATFDAQFTVNNPTHEHATFTGWNISGMDTTTHTYGAQTTNVTTLSGVTATTFKNLLATAGTVTFTATWNCDTGYAGTNCDAIDYNMQYVCEAEPGWNYRGSAPVATNPVHYGQSVQLAGDVYAELDGCRKVWGSPNDADYCDNCFTFGGWTIDAENAVFPWQDTIIHRANSTVAPWGQTNTTDWCIIDTGPENELCDEYSANDTFFVRPVYTPKQYNIEYMYATSPVSGASANMAANYTYTTETTISNADQTAPAHATFNGWCTGANGTGICVAAGQPITIGNRDHGDKRYYANWSCDTGYTLTYDANNQPVCSADAITCAAGFYLPAGATVCVDCIAGGYCPGGTYTYNPNLVQGITVCATNTYSNAAAAQCTACLTANGYQNSGDEFADHAYESSCKTTCAVGQCVATARAACANVGTTGWATGGNVPQGNTLACNVCPTGEMTIGYGVGANESGDCGRVLHVGDSQLYLRSDRKTDKTLNFKIGTKVYYANMSTDNMGMSHGATKALKLRFNNTTYSAYDDSALE